MNAPTNRGRQLGSKARTEHSSAGAVIPYTVYVSAPPLVRHVKKCGVMNHFAISCRVSTTFSTLKMTVIVIRPVVVIYLLEILTVTLNMRALVRFVLINMPYGIKL